MNQQEMRLEPQNTSKKEANQPQNFQIVGETAREKEFISKFKAANYGRYLIFDFNAQQKGQDFSQMLTNLCVDPNDDLDKLVETAKTIFVMNFR